MERTTIWHNPKCSKSRATLSLLAERGIEPHVVNYLEDPPSFDTLKRTLDLLDLEPRSLMRKTEAVYKELGLSNEVSDETLIRAMVENPILIERPIVIACGRAAIGRPPENVLEILE